ncbi:hypothetical protein SBOR_9567 [Sclerotinia borealis F-4128]|uniref:ABM domain-containing protein n=1 Tax=Sclerotinia borealis (strain F-4128) TaxID=1432307 RepID=W9C2X0_SCLBF|nr:hypothetical protein SBOR_9567 [Sclerotinia borealis F-4128]
MMQTVTPKDTKLRVQSWTRCRLPIDIPLPARVLKDYIEDLPDIWHVSLNGLMNAPGYMYSSYGRNIKNLEEVLFVAVWDDDTSLKAFLESPAYPQYLQAFGIHDSHTPGALFTVSPSFLMPRFGLGRRVTTFIFSFTYPASEENRCDLIGMQGLLVDRSLSRLGIRCRQVWVREPQIGGHGQLVEKGVVVQSWRDAEMHEAVDKYIWARENLQAAVQRINPLEMEETTWEMAKVEEKEDEDCEEDDGKVDEVNKLL